jgi:hypothetical protein
MNVIPGEVIIEPATNRPVSKSQPIEALSNLDAPMDQAEENQLRQAISNAVANNQDPLTIKSQDLAQGPITPVPQKFLKTDGTVDVDKIQASTRQLDEAIQNKQALVQKSVDDYLEMEKKFRNLPNPEKLAAQVPQITQAPTAPIPQGQLTPQQQEEIVRRDYAADPLGTTTRLLDLMLTAKFQPIEERNQIEARRQNIQKIAEKDPRILQSDYFDAVNAKLQADPDLWKLKNPHKAAWLEVKEEMRLGEPVLGQVQAQPSRPSVVLGGGSPPSVPSSSVQSSGQVDLSTLDIRDKKQEAMGDEAMRAMLNRR